jgi:hypothetical protein
MNVTECPLPKEYLISHSLPRIDYADVYQIEMPNNTTVTPRDAMVAFFQSFPRSFVALLLLRERLATLAGLKTAGRRSYAEHLQELETFRGEVGERIALFEVLDRSGTELMTGADDRHLDFRLSFIALPGGTVQLATVVKINNALGRAYFGVVRPIHRFYMRRVMRSMARRLLPHP